MEREPEVGQRFSWSSDPAELHAERARQRELERQDIEHRQERRFRRNRRGRLYALTGMASAVAIVAGVTGWMASLPTEKTGSFADTIILRMPTVGPEPGRGAADAPLGTPPALRVTSAQHAFLATQLDGPGTAERPVAWDPCRVISIVVNDRTAPDGADRLLDEAIESVSAATGLRFEIEGTTSEAPTWPRSAFDEEEYGDRWSPVLIAWSDGEESPELSGDVLGVAAPFIAGGFGVTPAVIVSGMVALDGPHLAKFGNEVGNRGDAQIRAVIMHELGHLVGLDHVDDPEELMHRHAVIGTTDFGEGDRTGLAELGTGECAPGL
jgi:hypothetical protein